MPDLFRRRVARLVLTAFLAGPALADDGFAPPPSVAPTAPVLKADTLATWHAFIRPDAEELRWLDIPWRPSLWQGVLDAQANRRPILLWTMNGHPMGCT